jgi:hypothetical protein
MVVADPQRVDRGDRVSVPVLLGQEEPNDIGLGMDEQAPV